MPTTLVEVVYPNTAAFSGISQLNEGPFFVPSVKRLLRAEVRGAINYQGATISNTSVFGNFQLWSLQWVPHGTPAQDCVTTADGVQWLIRQQIGTSDGAIAWAPSTTAAATLSTNGMHADWAGQLAINGDIDLYLSLRAPTGASIANMNLFASIRFWWV